MEVLEFIGLCLGLFLGIMCVPALAVAPRLMLTPSHSNAIPYVSLIALYAITRGLIYVHYFWHSILWLIVGVLGLIALYRAFRLFKGPVSHEWSRHAIGVLLINFGIVLPLVVSLALSAFVKEDALSGWNYWALHYYFQVIPQNVDSRAWLYPQFYPVMLAMGYKFLNSIEIQGPVKALLAVFPWTLLNCIGFSAKRKRFLMGPYFIIAIITLFPDKNVVKAFNFYVWGYADPMMAAAYVCALGYLIHYLRERGSVDLALLVVCAIVASLTKQPGLLLACLSVPLMLIVDCYQQRRCDRSVLFAMMVVALPGAMWVMSSKIGFYQNYGVIGRALDHQSITVLTLFKTWWSSVVKYFWQQPQLFLLFIVAAITAISDRVLAWIFLLSLIPGWFLWFILGSYHFRLGLHVIGTTGLLIAASDFKVFHDLKRQWHVNPERVHRVGRYTVMGSLALSLPLAWMLLFSTNWIHKSWHIEQNRLFDSPHLVLHRNFGKGAEFVRHHIYNNPRIQIWNDTKLIAGIFYGHNPILAFGGNNEAQFLSHIKQAQPDYLFDGNRVGHQESRYLYHIAQRCPQVFQQIPLQGAIHGYRLYKLNKASLTQCARALEDDKPLS